MANKGHPVVGDELYNYNTFQDAQRILCLGVAGITICWTTCRSPKYLVKSCEITDFVVRVEFQFRGAPHCHCLLWCKGAPDCDANGMTGVLFLAMRVSVRCTAFVGHRSC